MKKSFIKILMSLLLLIIPIMYFTHNVNALRIWARRDYVRVDASQIDFSPTSLLNLSYLNSPQIKNYLIACIRQSRCLSAQSIHDIESKISQLEFFCLESCLYDDHRRPLLRLWVPADSLLISDKEKNYIIPLQHA